MGAYRAVELPELPVKLFSTQEEADADQALQAFHYDEAFTELSGYFNGPHDMLDYRVKLVLNGEGYFGTKEAAERLIIDLHRERQKIKE